MKTLLIRTTMLVRDTVSGRRRLKRYTHPEAHRRNHHRDAHLAYHYIPTAQQIPVTGSSGM
ncbi:hypothetical protein [Streptomyces cinerochromogenes]|uniref:hypothetical protein n=1 Tax=Streptomyces cinerochromogenes TaxID=66422 RepID=UPI00166FC15D|nr:hypothetical protein [Streptomyces cinerochromogenes]GGS93845.1 hypothetical protein GCM10010206_65760 [Streptomyces cinerochromogenes]